MPLPRSPYLNARFAAAIEHFGADLKSSAGITHSVVKGSEREQSLTKFMRERLPDRFGVTTGEVVDLNGETAPQLDILIYDRYADFPFNSGNQSILAAEALLASVEIKSKLTSSELRKCAGAARKLRQLRPYNRELGARDVGKFDDGKKRARYMHCVFAFDTDLTAPRWPQNEVKRFDNEVGSEHLIDALYILGRGVVNFNYRKARSEDDSGGAITSFYFTVLNFVLREADRRQPTPYDRYVTHNVRSWRDI
ncbi:hypothetical protein G3545_11845 [Starkeya sp. ORNL1]|uniref:DUF6602 domain-containing protein n=1 Tax=Starkeya sp. ORNL1 TaxID=2709380 RepID=UPI0014636F2E|nr:DUF6602 domain-containing protein [Starkeya sp. ORNL1]QJP14281.1 hypothetical protein G3545_11845 [Starkeya sp. ORNL1]